MARDAATQVCGVRPSDVPVLPFQCTLSTAGISTSQINEYP